MKRSIKENYIFFSLGAVFGLSGGLLANIIDRYFSEFGLIYEIIVALLFFVPLFMFDRLINKSKSDK